MKKIISLFQRNYDGDRLVRDEVVPGAEWVINGEGIATRKFDGTAAMMKDGKLYLRYDVKNGKTAPPGFIPAQEPDAVTGHWPGWVPADENNPGHKWHCQALKNSMRALYQYPDGTHSFGAMDATYEICGPHFQGNPEKMVWDILIRHGFDPLETAPRTFDELKAWLADKDIEGIVWHHPDGRMAKIKKKDFGLKRVPA